MKCGLRYRSSATVIGPRKNIPVATSRENALKALQRRSYIAQKHHFSRAPLEERKSG